MGGGQTGYEITPLRTLRRDMPREGEGDDEWIVGYSRSVAIQDSAHCHVVGRRCNPIKVSYPPVKLAFSRDDSEKPPVSHGPGIPMPDDHEQTCSFLGRHEE
jgi:hypothetical protein